MPDAVITDTLPSQVDVRDRRPRDLHRGRRARSTCNLGKVLNGGDVDGRVKVHVNANAVSAPGHPIGITNSVEVGSDKVNDPDISQQQRERVDDRRGPRRPQGDEALQARPAGARGGHVDVHDPRRQPRAVGRPQRRPHRHKREQRVVHDRERERSRRAVRVRSPAASSRATSEPSLQAAGRRSPSRFTATEAQDINDCATVASATPDPNQWNNEACDGVTVIAVADLSLDKLDSPDPLVAGTDITYTLHAHNAGPSTAPNVDDPGLRCRTASPSFP